MTQTESKVLNPYPFLGCPWEHCWPRGFPLDQIIKTSQKRPKIKDIDYEVKVAVLQSLADHEPGKNLTNSVMQNRPRLTNLFNFRC